MPPWHAGHALARFGEFHLAHTVHVTQYPQSLGIVLAGQAESHGYCISGDVVMGRADAAGGEDIIIAGAQRIQRFDDCMLLVGDDAHFLQVYSGHGEHIREVPDILVLGASRQQFVADGEHGGGHDRWGG